MMMRDQADELRQLVRQRAVKPAHEGPGARVVVVAGGAAGVGATTVAVNLAVALARQGRRAVFVDADLEQSGKSLFASPPGHGTVVDVLTHPRHPYTQGLLDSVPSRSRRGSRLKQIPGMAPSVIDLPPGCAFRARCGFATDACAVAPEMRRMGPKASGQSARCHNPLGIEVAT